jgi:hypothetical protein
MAFIPISVTDALDRYKGMENSQPRAVLRFCEAQAVLEAFVGIALCLLSLYAHDYQGVYQRMVKKVSIFHQS